jgi:hypothetical protein
VLRAPLTRDHDSVIAAVTPEGRLLRRIQPAGFTGGGVVAVLRQLLHQVSGTLLVIWDGASIHHGRVVKDVRSAGAAAPASGTFARLRPRPQSR